MRAKIPSEAALLVAAEWRSGVKAVIGIDPDRACLDLSGHAVGQLDILRPTGRDQPVDSAVGDSDSFIRILEPDRRKHGAEDFLLRDLHVRLHLGENGGLYEEALAVVTCRIALAAAL